ncbi:MAG: SurA N-terminal domain-containing protein [Candidatus Saccharimonadales bacterium]
MKKLLHKLRKQKDEVQPSSRITSETVAHHRERILAGGRRFKYPIQYARHKLVINAVAISIVALIAILVVGWWQLYPQQNTSEFMYRITKVLPLPVANVDGEQVPYSDYLMKYLSSVRYLEQKEQVNLKTEDGKRQVSYIKQQSMQDAIADSYSKKLAEDMDLSTSDSDVEAFILKQRQSSSGETSEQTYYAVIQDYYGWSPSEYHHVIWQKLLRQKVAFAVDDVALDISNDIYSTLNKNSKTDFKTLAAKYAKTSGEEITYGVSGWVPKINQDGGLSQAAAKMSKNQVSTVIKSSLGDGYYIVRLLDGKDNQVNYEHIFIPLTVFDKKLEDIKNSGKINEYISIPKN